MEEKKKRTRKKKEAAEVMQEPIREEAGTVQDTPLEIYHVWQDGDNLDSVSKELTGRSFMRDRVLEYSGLRPKDVGPGAILKWRYEWR